MADFENIELRSDEVQEILGTPPRMLIRWGTTVLLLGLIALVFVAWYVKYPDVISAPMVLTSNVPPVEVIARTEGHIAQFNVEDKSQVNSGTILLVLQSTANYKDVMTLEKSVLKMQHMADDSLKVIRAPQGLELGELQAEFSIFNQNLEIVQFGKIQKSAAINTNKQSIKDQIEQLYSSIEIDKKNITRTKNQLSIAKGFLEKQGDLLSLGAISKLDYDREQQKVAAIEHQIELLDEGIIRKKNEIIGLQKSINETNFSEIQDNSTATIHLRESINTLRTSIDKWKQTYLLTAPVSGLVSLNSTFFGQQQFVKQGDVVVTIVPQNKDSIIGRVTLPVKGSGKVKAKQRVILHLDSYPDYEFGTITGEVVSKSLIPKNNEYIIQISLPKGDSLHTNYKRTIPFEQQLTGRAEIITDDKRFLERIWEQVFARTLAYQ